MIPSIARGSWAGRSTNTTTIRNSERSTEHMRDALKSERGKMPCEKKDGPTTPLIGRRNYQNGRKIIETRSIANSIEIKIGSGYTASRGRSMTAKSVNSADCVLSVTNARNPNCLLTITTSPVKSGISYASIATRASDVSKSVLIYWRRPSNTWGGLVWYLKKFQR